jgi:hypothetical protein
VLHLDVLWKQLFDEAKAPIEAARAHKKPDHPLKAKGVSPDDWLRFLKTAHASLYACSGMARKRPCGLMKTHL